MSLSPFYGKPIDCPTGREWIASEVPVVIVDDVYRAFLTCGLWADLIALTEDGDVEHVDDAVELDDIVNSGDAWSLVRDFLTTVANGENVAAWEYVENHREQAGHDLWLTANHHGAGFWDRGLGEVGDYLTSLAHPFGELTLMRDSDGVIRFDS